MDANVTQPTLQQRVDAIPYEKPKEGFNGPRVSRVRRSSQYRTGFQDQWLSPYRTYLGMKRRTFLIVLLIAILALLALIIGLSVGLTRKKSSSQFLPLPSDRRAFQGDLTYYGPGLGACGITSTDADNIVSVSHYLYDSVQKDGNPNSNPLCGLTIRAVRVDSRDNETKSLDLKVVDRCTGCQPTDLDVSPGAFNQLADPNLGRVQVVWAWLSAPPADIS